VKVIITHGDILAVPAEVLICSANIGLRLSGGVGGAIRIKFGNAVADGIQAELDHYLQSRGIAHANQGDVIPTSGGGSPFRTILHAIAVDGIYDSSVPIVRKTVGTALSLAKANRVALTALATGYGHLSIKQFGQAIASLFREEYPPVNTVTICVRHESDAQELTQMLSDFGYPH